MPKIVKAPAEGTKVAEGKTLADLAADAGEGVDWTMIAKLNWGSSRPIEVVRALVETIGVDLKHLHDKDKLKKPETIPFKPHKNLEAKLRIPEIFTVKDLAADQVHTIEVKTLKPANAVSILELDKWFIPDAEECEIKYALSGLKDTADKLRVDIFASNYCDCTDWNDGVGKFDKGELEKEPVYVKDALKADAHGEEQIKWKGNCTTKKGLLGVKIKDEDKRHVNAAFSPYTVQFTYHKAALPETDRPQIVLQPFWPEWELEPSTPSAAAGLNGPSFEVHWKNDDDVEGLSISISDAQGVEVFRTARSPKLKTKKEGGKHSSELERDDLLKKGDRKFDWNQTYRSGVRNGKMTNVMLDDSAWSTDMQKQFLYQSTPYKAVVTTIKPKLKADSLKIKWKILNSGGKFKRGYVCVKDRVGRTVFLEPLSPALMTDAEHETTWDGKYPDGVLNTLGEKEITRWDMPYRVELQAHTEAGADEGLALAAKHSEVRLYTHETAVATLDPRYDSDDFKPGLLLEAGPLLAKAELEGDAALKPFVAPKDKTSDAWFRYKLAETGFHPGPLETTDAAPLDMATAEFRRSVPKKGADGAPFSRMDQTTPTARDADVREAIEKIRPTDRRRIFGDPGGVSGNSDAPYFEADPATPYHASEAEKKKLRDPAAEVVVWVDDRQYYTDPGAQPKDKADADYFSTTDGTNLNLNDYRGGMVNADARTSNYDRNNICRPWVPFRATPTLLSRADEHLYTAWTKDRIELTGDRLKKVRAAIGPLRVDWSVEELPYDIANVDPADYPSTNFKGDKAWDGKTEVRTRRYLTHALWSQKGEWTRKDTKRKTILTNCPDDRGGARPKASTGTYASKVFGVGENRLWPWKAEFDADAEAVKTVAHDLIHKDQGLKELEKPLVADEQGSACAWFNPSRIGGDGYRVSARVMLKKDDAGDAFPNLETLEKRYPVTPMAHSAKLRLWRRSSFRGFIMWKDGGGTIGGAKINQMRDYYKVGHTYFVHEGGAQKNFTSADIVANDFKKMVHYNMKRSGFGAWWETEANVQKAADYPYPFDHHDHMGLNYRLSVADYANFNNSAKSIWNSYNGGLLFMLAETAEKQGYMRGHLVAEFVSCSEFKYHVLTCDTTPAHRYVRIRKDGVAAPPDEACPDCAGTLQATAATGVIRFNLNGIGLAIGVCWNFIQPDANIITHEIGHHRHFEHSSNGPFTKPDLHDSADNSVVNWVTDAALRAVWWDDVSHHTATDPNAPSTAVHQSRGKQWDRRCMMSYANDSRQYFCGKCALRNRGWEVVSLPALAGDNRDPA